MATSPQRHMVMATSPQPLTTTPIFLRNCTSLGYLDNLCYCFLSNISEMQLQRPIISFRKVPRKVKSDKENERDSRETELGCNFNRTLQAMGRPVTNSTSLISTTIPQMTFLRCHMSWSVIAVCKIVN